MTHPVLQSEVREAHPGWAVKFNDGSWLCTAMMCNRVNDAFYATRYESESRALAELKLAKEDEPDVFANVQGFVVEAWQPLSESLRVKISSLKEALNVSPDDIFELTMVLESALAILKDSTKDK